MKSYKKFQANVGQKTNILSKISKNEFDFTPNVSNCTKSDVKKLSKFDQIMIKIDNIIWNLF